MLDTSLPPITRLQSNESITSTMFSRNSSSSSVATTVSAHNYSPIAKTSLCSSPLSSPMTSLAEALHLSFKSNTFNNRTSKDIAPTTTPTNESSPQYSKWCVVLVGLPASGKSTITRNLIEKLKTSGDINIETFNAGVIRRKLSNFESQDSEFFDFNNPRGKKQRDLFATMALDHLLTSLVLDQIDVGILDATNSTRDRRDFISKTIKQRELETGIKINTLVLEIRCEDAKCWEYNARAKTRGPDYITKGYDVALRDFINRAENYKAAFEKIEQEERDSNKGVYITINDVGRDVTKIHTQDLEDEDVVFQEIDGFVKEYYESFGKDYIQMVYDAEDI